MVLGVPLVIGIEKNRMMTTGQTYDIGIVGGGLAGLTLAIQLQRKGISCVLFEKETYPFHKVCGEYISMESYGFLERLGLPLSEMNLPIIHQLLVTSPNGNQLFHQLGLGGFGISRFTLDKLLYRMALDAGVTVFQASKVTDIKPFGEGQEIISTTGNARVRLVCGSWGKRANMDIKLNRSFITPVNRKLSNYIGVKYHIEADEPENRIALHHFKDGYCGISKTDDGRFNLCYLTTADNLKQYGGDIKQMEEAVLYKNPHLKRLFTQSRFIFDKPLAISQISFERKTTYEQGILMLGDAAGLITPLCGNGMSMAMHASLVLAGYVEQFTRREITSEQLRHLYNQQWQQLFGRRLKAGRLIQGMFGNEKTGNLVVSLLKPFPALVDVLVKNTHGKPF